MPAGYLAPGVYVQWTTGGVCSITGVPTSITAFVGRTVRGPSDAPGEVRSFGDFEQTFGGLSPECPLGYAVRQFFDNGGTHAWIARLVHRTASGAEYWSDSVTDADIDDPVLAAQRRGLWLLDQVDLVNLLCIPPLGRTADVAATTWNTAIQYARRRRAFVIVDPPSAWTTAALATAGVDRFVARDENAALDFPRILARDPLAETHRAGSRPAARLRDCTRLSTHSAACGKHPPAPGQSSPESPA